MIHPSPSGAAGDYEFRVQFMETIARDIYNRGIRRRRMIDVLCVLSILLLGPCINFCDPSTTNSETLQVYNFAPVIMCVYYMYELGLFVEERWLETYVEFDLELLNALQILLHMQKFVAHLLLAG